MSAPAAKAKALSVTRTELEDFLYHEAALLDEWRLEEWLALFVPGARYLVPPAGSDDDVDPAAAGFTAHGLAAAVHLEEGSGISRNNHFTARGLAKVLELFAPHADLLHGHDGGMNKTGSMEGIRTLAGYANTSSHGRVRFVISLTSNDDEMRFRLLRTIESEL